jgi:hypothetical protein
MPMLVAFRTKSAAPQCVAIAIIACALLMRILVPEGWMPVRTGDGWRITICTGIGPMPTDMAGMPGMHHRSEGRDRGSNDHPCAFTGLAMAMDEPPPLLLDLPRSIPETWSSRPALAVGVGRGLAAPPPPSTGPPGP